MFLLHMYFDKRNGGIIVGEWRVSYFNFRLRVDNIADDGILRKLNKGLSVYYFTLLRQRLPFCSMWINPQRPGNSVNKIFMMEKSEVSKQFIFYIHSLKQLITLNSAFFLRTGSLFSLAGEGDVYVTLSHHWIWSLFPFRNKGRNKLFSRVTT